MTKLDELEALERAAREGPWIAHGNAVCGGVDGDYAVAECHGPGLLGQQEDAALIAAARNALPALLRIARAALALDMSAEVEGCIYSGDGACPGCDVCALHDALAALR